MILEQFHFPLMRCGAESLPKKNFPVPLTDVLISASYHLEVLQPAADGELSHVARWRVNDLSRAEGIISLVVDCEL
jgi:hypothetical protein